MSPEQYAYNTLKASADRLTKRLAFAGQPAPYLDPVTGETKPAKPAPRGPGLTPQFVPELGGFQFHDPERGWTITVVVDQESMEHAKHDPYYPIAFTAAGFVHDPDMDACVDRAFTTTDLEVHRRVVEGKVIERPPGLEAQVEQWVRILSRRSTEPEPKVYLNDDKIQYQDAKPEMDYDGPLFVNIAEADHPLPPF